MPVDFNLALASDPGDPDHCVGRIPDSLVGNTECDGHPCWRGRLSTNPARWFYSCERHVWMLQMAEPFMAI